jgi:hypothetical protein
MKRSQRFSITSDFTELYSLKPEASIDESRRALCVKPWIDPKGRQNARGDGPVFI